MLFVKHLHASLALISIAGFFLRGLWQASGSPLFHARLTRLLPHLVDTGLLATALTLLYLYRWNPLDHPWLLAKIGALLAYIGFGIMAFRIERRPERQRFYWALALCSAAYLLAVAFTKSPLPFFG